MALQDLTPQLRTRLSRMERAVGWFVLLAAALLAFGFGYYLYQTAARKGWFIQKINYQTSLANATGLKQGDPVMLMGFNVGEITRIEANGPWDYYGVTIYFRVKAPYFGYIWSDSKVKVAGADFLGNRMLEVTKGRQGLPTVAENTNKVAVGVLKEKYLHQQLKGLQDQQTSLEAALAQLNRTAATNQADFYGGLAEAKPYWLEPAESPAVTERLEAVINQVETALPNVLRLTNQLAQVLENSAHATSNLNLVAVSARPAAENLASLSAQLRGPGALGEWALPPGGAAQLGAALTNANVLLANTDTNLAQLAAQLSQSLDSLANITSNLNAQVQGNSNLVQEVSDVIVHSDEFVQGLKHHWLLRSAFKTPKTNEPPASPQGVLHAPNDPFQK
jgi:ABC-type transporter Mla subunit MlaD